jgi:lipopolysaccharide export system protein LptC
MERRTIFAIVMLALAALATQLLLWLIRPPEEPPAFVGPPRSNYTLGEFEMHALDDAGKLSFTVTGPRLARRNDDGSMWVETPHFVMAGSAGGGDWKGESDNAWINKDGSQMLLAGAVQMHRDAQGKIKPARVETRDVTAWPKDKKLETAADATLSQPGAVQSGTGMKADLASHQLELLANVHATFAPKSKR